MSKNERMCKKRFRWKIVSYTINQLFLLILWFSVPNSVTLEITFATSISRLTIYSL